MFFNLVFDVPMSFLSLVLGLLVMPMVPDVNAVVRVLVFRLVLAFLLRLVQLAHGLGDHSVAHRERREKYVKRRFLVLLLKFTLQRFAIFPFDRVDILGHSDFQKFHLVAA